jgi:hypothetical protein
MSQTPVPTYAGTEAEAVFGLDTCSSYFTAAYGNC